MATGNTITTVDAILKEFYDDDGLTVNTYMKNPLWALMTKQEDVSGAVGRSFIHPINYAHGQGRAVNFGLAQSEGNSTSELSAEFAVTRVQNYQTASLSTLALLATQTNRGAFIDAVTYVMDGCLQNLGLDQSIAMYGTGAGNRGNISASTNVATSQLVLALAGNAVNFEVGMQLDLAATVNGAVRAYGTAGHGLFVIAVDRTNGVLTIGTTPNPATATPVAINDATNGIPTAADGDFIFQRGDQGLKMVGVEAWIPYGGVTSTPFFGVDRTTDSVRLGGNWLDGTKLSIEDAFIQAASNVANQGFELTHFFLPFNKFAQLIKSQSAKVEIVREEITPQVGFDGIEVMTPSGKVMCIPDRNCPANRIYGLNLDTWRYTHVGDPVQVWNYDGNTWLRQASDDGMELRVFSFGNLVCRNPAANITIKVNP